MAPPAEPGSSSPALHAAAVTLWLLVEVAATAAAATAVVDVRVEAGLDVPGWLAAAGGGVVVVLHVAALAYRVGAATWLWTGLAAAGTAAGLLSEEPWALSAVAVLAAVVSAVAAVLLTRPVTSAWRSLVECLVALAVASAGALAVAGIDAPVRPDRYTLVVAGAALALAIYLVWQLGTERHGLGRTGLAAILGCAVVATGVLAYTQVLRTYGSPGLVERLDEVVVWLTDTVHGVPRPVAALLGFPALVWGINARGRRAQGWWLCVFGALGTAMVTSCLAPRRLDPELAALSAAYSVLIGALLGLVVWRLDALLTGSRRNRGEPGRRARRSDLPVPTRSEPARTRPLR